MNTEAGVEFQRSPRLSKPPSHSAPGPPESPLASSDWAAPKTITPTPPTASDIHNHQGCSHIPFVINTLVCLITSHVCRVSQDKIRKPATQCHFVESLWPPKSKRQNKHMAMGCFCSCSCFFRGRQEKQSHMTSLLCNVEKLHTKNRQLPD